MRLRPTLLLLATLGLLAACAPTPDSPTRGAGPALEVQLTAPRTCLNGRCISYIPRTGNVFAPDRVTIPIPRGIVGPDGYMTAANFNQLLRLASEADLINARRPGF